MIFNMKCITTIVLLLIEIQFNLCADIPFKHGTEVIKGYGAKKEAVVKCGGNALDLAVGMLEGPMDANGYPYGDKKTGDSANFGIFKQNWGMIRLARPEWAHLTGKDYAKGAELNHNLCMDVSTLHASQKRLGLEKWFTGHRAGSSAKATDPIVKDYRESVEWIKAEIDKDYKKFSTDDTRIWVYQKPI